MVSIPSSLMYPSSQDNFDFHPEKKLFFFHSNFGENQIKILGFQKVDIQIKNNEE